MFKLDGGAMFGVVPKKLWHKLNPPDENNMCTWSMKCLLLEVGEKKILFDTGMGIKQGEKFRSHFEPHGPFDLFSSLQQLNISKEDITDVFLTHYHFDHVGGAVSKEEDGRLSPAFPNATFWSNQAHIDWATEPNARERASFLKENFVPLQEAGVIRTLEAKEEMESWTNEVDVLYVNGHTEKMMIPHIRINGRTVVFCADLLPSAGHLGMPYVMSYDIRPLVTLEEKGKFLKKAVENNYILYLEHDPVIECIEIGLNEKGRFAITNSGSLAELLEK
jgi:glyoxylase-like metal-dependent hydrolase (beta-lactamase superfamily II)